MRLRCNPQRFLAALKPVVARTASASVTPHVLLLVAAGSGLATLDVRRRCRELTSTLCEAAVSPPVAKSATAQGASSSSSSSTIDARVRSWLHERGGQLVPTVKVQDVAGAGLGLVNTGSDRIRCGTVLVLVPWPLIVSREMTERDPGVQRHRPQGREQSPSLGLRLWLVLQATDPHSDWAPWLCSLPSGPSAGSPALPLALEGRELRALRGTSLAAEARGLRERLLVEWELLDRHIGAPLYGEADWSHWLWAQAVLSTRSSTLELGKERQPLQCIVPVVDFANHSGAPNALVASSAAGAQLVAARDIAAGEEVRISYGSHDADQFLFAFGFLPSGAPLDSIVAPLPPAPTRAVAELRAELFGPGRPPRLQARPGGFKELLLALGPGSGEHSLATDLSRLLRLLRAWEAELEPLSSSPVEAFLSAWRRPVPADLEVLRARHRAIVAAAAAEVESELAVLGEKGGHTSGQ